MSGSLEHGFQNFLREKHDLSTERKMTNRMRVPLDLFEDLFRMAVATGPHTTPGRFRAYRIIPRRSAASGPLLLSPSGRYSLTTPNIYIRFATNHRMRSVSSCQPGRHTPTPLLWASGKFPARENLTS